MRQVVHPGCKEKYNGEGEQRSIRSIREIRGHKLVNLSRLPASYGERPAAGQQHSNEITDLDPMKKIFTAFSRIVYDFTSICFLFSFCLVRGTEPSLIFLSGPCDSGKKTCRKALFAV